MKPVSDVHELFHRAVRNFTDEDVPDALVDQVLPGTAARESALPEVPVLTGMGGDVMITGAPVLDCAPKLSRSANADGVRVCAALTSPTARQVPPLPASRMSERSIQTRDWEAASCRSDLS